MPSVRILNGPEANKVFELNGGEVVGRDPAAVIHVVAPGVSRRHFQFELQGSDMWLVDVGSSNGTYVNNQRIKRHQLRENDRITVGGVNMVFSQNTQPGLAPTPGAPISPPGTPPNLGATSDEIQVGGFAAAPAGFGTPAGFGGAPGGFGGAPGGFAMAPGNGPTQVPAANPVVQLKDDEDDEGGEDFSLDASIIFKPGAAIPTEDKVEALEKRLQIMFEISQALADVATLEELLDKIVDEIFNVFPQTDRGFIMIGNTVDDLKPAVVRNRKGDNDEVQISRTIAKKVIDEKQGILSQNAMEDDRFSGGMSIINFRILCMACVPLIYRDEVFGLIMLDTQDRAKKFTPDDLNLLAGIAAQAATFIKNLRLVELAQKEAAARSNFERYFSPDLADQVASGEVDLKLGGDNKTGTVFFSDIIGFTSMSENMTPSEVVAKINRYMKYMVEIVFKYKGSVDKFIGDCIMAVWGTPKAVEDEAVMAISAAVEMQNALFLLNGEFYAEGDKPIHMGIGLNSGSFVAGNMGSERRMEYTVIGDNVNLAQRVESKAGRGMVYVSDTTWERSKHKAIGVKLNPIKVKGKENPVTCYSIRGVEQASSTGKVFMTSLPCAVNAWAEECQRALMVKARLSDDTPDKALALILFHTRPEGETVTLEFYAPEIERFSATFEVQGEVPIKSDVGCCCLKGQLNLDGTPLRVLFDTSELACDKTPDEIPRGKTPA